MLNLRCTAVKPPSSLAPSSIVGGLSSLVVVAIVVAAVGLGFRAFRLVQQKV